MPEGDRNEGKEKLWRKGLEQYNELERSGWEWQNYTRGVGQDTGAKLGRLSEKAKAPEQRKAIRVLGLTIWAGRKQLFS